MSNALLGPNALENCFRDFDAFHAAIVEVFRPLIPRCLQIWVAEKQGFGGIIEGRILFIRSGPHARQLFEFSEGQFHRDWSLAEVVAVAKRHLGINAGPSKKVRARSLRGPKPRPLTLADVERMGGVRAFERRALLEVMAAADAEYLK